jgi:hypothetical protein
MSDREYVDEDDPEIDEFNEDDQDEHQEDDPVSIL